MRLIDAGAFKEGWNDSVLGNTMRMVIDGQSTIDPESLPVVKQLRAELERLKEGPAFNVGDSVWQTDGIDVYELEVKRLIYDCGYIAFDASAIGKRIFKTSSEAEAAMAKAKEAAHE